MTLLTHDYIAAALPGIQLRCGIFVAVGPMSWREPVGQRGLLDHSARINSASLTATGDDRARLRRGTKPARLRRQRTQIRAGKHAFASRRARLARQPDRLVAVRIDQAVVLVDAIEIGRTHHDFFFREK